MFNYQQINEKREASDNDVMSPSNKSSNYASRVTITWKKRGRFSQQRGHNKQNNSHVGVKFDKTGTKL